MIDNYVLLLQNCMDSLKVEPGSCSGTYVTSSGVDNQVIGIKVEEGSNVEEEEEDPLLIPFTPIKSEYEVSVICVRHVGNFTDTQDFMASFSSLFVHWNISPMVLDSESSYYNILRRFCFVAHSLWSLASLLC